MGDPIRQYIKQLIGLKLSIARIGALHAFHFGKVRLIERGSVGEFALHVNCAWRIENRVGIEIGFSDLYRPAQGKRAPAEWTYKDGDSVLDERLGELLQGYDLHTKSYINVTDLFVVQRCMLSQFGDLTIYLSGDYRIRLFVRQTDGEAWRVFRPNNLDTPHLVVGTNQEGLWYRLDA